MRILRNLFLLIFAVFLLPALLTLGYWWGIKDRPQSWRAANWSSTGILARAEKEPVDQVLVMAARTGGIKGALAVHTWILTKRAGEREFTRYDKVGWGTPIRVNAYAADARWYSNPSFVVKSVRGKEAARLIPKVENAIKSYPYNFRGGYTLWPGPNSNSFVAHVMNAVPELNVSLPGLAVGRNFISGGRWFYIDPDYENIQVTWRGLFGFAAGRRHGFEFHFLGLVSGFDIADPAVKLPGIGRIDFGDVAQAASW